MIQYVTHHGDIKSANGRGDRFGELVSDGQRFPLADIEARLIHGPDVADCVVLARTNLAHAWELVAYVVPNPACSLGSLEDHIRSTLTALPVRWSWVLLANLPLTSDGDVDIDHLCRLAVVDSEQLEVIEATLRAVPGIDQVAADLQVRTNEEPPLHVSDVLMNWRSLGAQTEDETAVDPQTDSATDLTSGQASAAALALADGGPLTMPDDAPTTLTDALQQTARRFPNKGIRYVMPDGSQVLQTYPDLLEGARRILAGLRDNGLGPGDKVILQVPSLPDHFASFWACVLGGIVPVTVAVAPSYSERNAVVDKLFNTWRLLDEPVILSDSPVIERLMNIHSLFPDEAFQVLPVGRLKQHPPSHQIHRADPDDLVFFQLTSGSTGIPKCIQESHRGIVAHIHGSQQFNRYSCEDVCLNWLPVDHVVPILTFHLKDVYLGCNEIQLPPDIVLADPLRWLDLIEANNVTHTWSPNFGFKLVADGLAVASGRKWDLSSVKFFMNAGEQVTQAVVEDFLARVAPFGVAPCAMQPAFGMAEACTCMTYQNEYSHDTGVHRIRKSSLRGMLQPSTASDSSAITFVDLGPPIPGVQIRIADAQNQTLPESTIGRFQIKGDVITRGYLKNDDANQESFVGEGWFNTGDLGFMLNGRLTLTGREKEMIVVRGANFYCYEIEDVVNRIAGVEATFTGSCAVVDPATGSEGLAVFTVLEDSTLDGRLARVQEIRSAIATNFGITPDYVVPLDKDEFPKTTSGKIQRSVLKKSLEDGKYNDNLRRIDVGLGTANTVPDWFFRKVWRLKTLSDNRQTAPTPARTVVFADTSGFRDCLCRRMAEAGHKPVIVESGNAFGRIAPDRYCIDLRNPEHYDRLFSALTERDGPVDSVVHAWTYGAQSADTMEREAIARSMEMGVYSVLFMAQSLAKLDEAARPSRLMVVSSHAQRVTPGDTLDCTRSAVLGLLRTIGHELPWLRCNHLDVPADDADVESGLALRELETEHTDLEVSCRNGRRLVERLRRVDFAKDSKRPIAIEGNGLYLVSGGLGGIGTHIAAQLIRKFGARLLIVGRSQLPDRGSWSQHLLESGDRADRIRAYQDLEQLGDVRYESVDIVDSEALDEAVKRAEAAWSCKLKGVFHLAGVYGERTLTEERLESFEEVVRPKVLGTATLHRLLEDHGGTLFVSFSSAIGHFGGFASAAYSTANAFLNAFADFQRDVSAIQSFSLAWSHWDEVGMSRDFAMKQLARQRGYQTIGVEHAMTSFFATLHQEIPLTLIGLDAERPSIQSEVDIDDLVLKRPRIFVVSQDAMKAPTAIADASLRDRFGNRIACDCHPIDRVPVNAEGLIDRNRLSARESLPERNQENPETEIEKQLASIWKTVLGVPVVGRDDDFFRLGGHSLSAVQLTAKVEQTFGIRLSLATLLRAPALSTVAVAIEEELIAQTDVSELEALAAEIERDGGPTQPHVSRGAT